MFLVAKKHVPVRVIIKTKENLFLIWFGGELVTFEDQYTKISHKGETN